MAPKRGGGGGAGGGQANKKSSSSSNSNSSSGALPRPLKPAPASLEPFYSTLSPAHVYVAHVDSKPRDFKRKIFLVPVAMNLAVALLFLWRLWYIGPYYLQLAATTLGHVNETTLAAADLPWRRLVAVVLRRGLTFTLDLVLAVFVWPWPVEFCVPRSARGGSPVWWRWRVGFRDREVYVRRSRDWYKPPPTTTQSRSSSSSSRGGVGGDVVADAEARAGLLARVKVATAPLMLQDKTGYLTMDGYWDLDWAAMVAATALVDAQTLPLDAFRTLVLLHHEDHGWICVDLQVATGGSSSSGDSVTEDERRRQVFAFRDALAAVGKEDLFFRWIEVIQFESSQPSGFGPEKQVEVAAKIRELFKANDIDFDEFWREAVGSDGLAGM